LDQVGNRYYNAKQHHPDATTLSLVERTYMTFRVRCTQQRTNQCAIPTEGRNLESICVTLPDYPTLFWVTAVFAMILIGISKSGFVGGVGAIATPVMALTISVTDAAAILLPILIVADLFSLRHYWNVYDRASIKLMIPGALVGILLGAIFFGYFSDNERTLKLILGIVSLLFVAYQLARSLILGALLKAKPPKWAGVLLGGVAGFTSTLAHAGGPPATSYLLPQQLPRSIFVGTSVIFFFTLNLVKLIPYAMLGLLRVGNVSTILILAPLTFVGVQLGVWLNKRFSDRYFTYVIYALLLLTGIELVSGVSVVRLLFG
jgi:uncharacterized membrane protein YfcA